MGRIRLVALDIDGTLADGGHIVDTNRVAITSARESGILFILATARAYPSAARFARELGLKTPIVCCGGALARWPDSGEELWHLRIPMEAALRIAWFADDHRYELCTALDDVTYLRQRAGEPLGYLDEGHCVLETNRAALTKPPTSILAFGHATIAAIRNAFQEPLRSDVGFRTEWRGNEFTSLTMVHTQASKGWAFGEVCRRLEVPLAETLAIGDSQSDIDMFSRAGISVAVGGAPDDVLRKADHVAPPCQDGAVSWALRSFVDAHHSRR